MIAPVRWKGRHGNACGDGLTPEVSTHASRDRIFSVACDLALLELGLAGHLRRVCLCLAQALPGCLVDLCWQADLVDALVVREVLQGGTALDALRVLLLHALLDRGEVRHAGLMRRVAAHLATFQQLSGPSQLDLALPL